jgi:hypothetical protein
MAKRHEDRLKTVKAGVPYIGCSGCRTVVKFGYMNEDVMFSPDRITKEDWNGSTAMYCKECTKINLEKRK